MTKKALILHCWYGDPTANWYPWLKDELETRGYEVFMPELPTMKSDLPDMSQQIDSISELLTVDSETLVVGHSLGAVLALKLAEKHQMSKMILVSGWYFNDLTSEHQLFWKSPIDHEAIIKNVSHITCVTSDNDPYFSAFQTEEMSKRLRGSFVLVKGAGHFTKDKFGITEIPSILEEI